MKAKEIKENLKRLLDDDKILEIRKISEEEVAVLSSTKIGVIWLSRFTIEESVLRHKNSKLLDIY